VPDIQLIIAGVDGSEQSKVALAWAYDEATHHGAALTVVTTWHVPTLPMSAPYGSLPDKDYERQPRTNALALLDELVAGLEERSPAVDVRTSIEEGHAAEVLIERSKEGDLLVVGARGHGGFAGMLLGSVSQHLVAHAHCPVVVVR
jgi:nucleotide-binding universal stress UspA family protein